MSTQQIADLFIAAGSAHHQAFIETDGADAEWPLWYANYLHKELPRLLNAEMTQSEIVYWIIKLDKEYRVADRNEGWPIWYARQLQENFDE